MAPAPPLPVTEDTPPDMLAGSMDLRVVLPGGRSVKMSAERCTPMMDLLVQITTANKMAPGGYILQPVGERGVLPYKPSTPIGALDTWMIQIVPKTRTLNSTNLKKAPLKPNNQQPFEQTFRLQVHLPRNQLFVTRVSPKSLLSDVLNLACSEKNLDPNKYELRHPANLEERLRPEWTLADYKLQEVTLVAKGNRPLGSGLSSSDIMALQKEEEKRRQQVRANGGTGSTVLGLMLGKNSQSSGCDGSISSDSLGGRSISPSRSDETPSPPGSSLPPPRPIRKRRPAPKPPTEATQPHQHSAVISHSRNSSDSSGYHEASILSESPESNGLSSSPSGTLPRRSKLSKSAGEPTNVAASHNLSRSLSNLAHMGNGEHKSGPITTSIHKNGHSISTTSLASSGHGKKKKAAPPPPVVRSTLPGHLLPEQRTASLSTLSSQSSGDSFDRDIYSKSSIMERPSSSQSSTTSNIIKQESLPEENSVIEENEFSPPQNGSVQDLSFKTHLKTKSLTKENKLGEKQFQPNERKLQESKDHYLNKNKTCNLKQHPVHCQVEEKSIPLEPEVLVKTNHHITPKYEDVVLTPESAVVSKPSNKVASDHTANIVAPPRASLPDVVSGKETNNKFPTPKPRVICVTKTTNKPPTPQPRARRCFANNNEFNEKSSVLLDESMGRDSAIDSDGTRCSSPRTSDAVKSHGKFSGTFGVGKTMVMLAASGKDSVNSESRKDSKSITSDSEAEMTTRFGTDNEYEDGLNISENDLEMFETKSEKTTYFPAEISAPDSVSLLGSMSVASSVFDSEHETSDGTWEKSSISSQENNKQLAARPALQQSSAKESVELKRPFSFSNKEEVNAFLEQECSLEHFPVSKDLLLHTGTKERTELQKERDVIQQEFECVTKELQAMISAEEAKQAAPVVNLSSPKTESSSLSLVDWEYHLPAPPSAFRDCQSPDLSLERDSVSLSRDTNSSSEVPICDEVTTEVLPPAEFTDFDKSDVTEPNLTSLMIENECPLITNLVKGVTKVNPLFNEEKYEADLLEERKMTVEKVSTKVASPLMVSNETFKEEDWNPQPIAESVSVEVDSKDQVKSMNSSSPKNHNVHQLKNFTISAYQRPHAFDTFLNGGDVKAEFEFKKSSEISFNRQKDTNNFTDTKIPRNNSFSSKNNLLCERSPVKRSASHVSLNNSGRTYRTKSIGNLSVEDSRQGCGLPTTENTLHKTTHEGLRKTTSEANINQDNGKSSRLADLQDEFLQWQEQLLLQTQPDIPLQSLQVLRRILSPAQDDSRDKTKEKWNADEHSPGFVDSNVPLPRNSECSETLELAFENTNEVKLRRQPNSPTNRSNTRYSYQGPPAVNFSTWSERPKSQVSIKVDNDYRIGKGQNTVSSGMPNKAENGQETNENIIGEDQLDSKVISSQLSKSEYTTQMNGHTKTEPTALTMRIISHTTPSGYKKASYISSNFLTKPQDTIQHKVNESSTLHPTGTRVHSYNSAQISDPSRVPIVRAVELKKSFLQGQQNVTLPEKNCTTSIKLSWNEENDQIKSNPVRGNINFMSNNNNGNNNDVEEKFQGVNNLAKRFSLASLNSENVTFNHNNTRPVSAYSSNDFKSKFNPDLKKVVSSNSKIKESSGMNCENGNNGAKKYTSVVGVNGGSESNNKETTLEINRQNVNAVQRSGSTCTSKLPGLLNARQPMPVVKGFRYATSDYSDTSLVAADSYKVPLNQQPTVTVKVQQNSFQDSNQRNSVVAESPVLVNLRMQPTVSKRSSVPSSGSQQVSEPPSAPALPKKMQISRPKSNYVEDVNPRDQLMDAIRSFGGRGNLRQTKAS